ncbi:nitroreductase family protein [Pseudonocardia acaciae]|uniref:nitroreductase family protein n=1 Tax=Pseudonocardia acaciae TaxID=551276 RepID=UPI0012ECFED7|nr:nitroreductase family protein [Pseudonocardia acaciae]
MTTLPLSPDELLTTTRSVRKRLDLDRPVPLELVRECLQLALQAPSGSNRQNWHFVVVTDAEQRATIGEYYLRSYTDYSAARPSAADEYPDDGRRAATQVRVIDSATYLAERMGQVPVLVIACIDAGTADLPASNQAGLWGSLLPAAWNYMLAARARGLGTAWTTLHLAYERQIAELLGIPDTVHQGVLLPTAYYTGETFKPAHRQPLHEIVHINGW